MHEAGYLTIPVVLHIPRTLRGLLALWYPDLKVHI